MNSWFPGGTTLNAVDFLVVGLSLLGLFAIGFWTGRGEKSTADFFLGRRRIPAWAVVFSFVATEISAMTIIGVPATTYRENWQYLQFFIGSAAARVMIATLFIPVFYYYNCTTIYEFLKHRFGPQTQYAGTVFFFITRLLASGVRLMAACVAVSVLLDWRLVPVIALFTLVSVVYIGFGGIRAVVWTNVYQAALFVAAGLAVLVYLTRSFDGGLAAAWETARAGGRLDLINLGPAWGEPGYWGKFFSDPNVIFIAVVNGFFLNMAAFGTDHELMQRLLTVETRRESQRTMLWTMAGSLGVLLIYVCLGTGLFVYYQQHPELPLPKALDKIYPHFTVQVLPQFLRGLVLCSILMASIDSPLASLSASFVTDIYRPLVRRDASEKHYLFVSRVAVAIGGLLLGLIAYAFSSYDKMLWLAFKIGGVTYGSLLGVFLLGLLSKRRANRANVVSMSATAVLCLVLLVLSEKKIIGLGWTWLIVLGTFGTMGLSWWLGPRMDSGEAPSAFMPR